MTDETLVLPLDAIDPADPAALGRVGGKATNLGGARPRRARRPGRRLPDHRGLPAGRGARSRCSTRRSWSRRTPAPPSSPSPVPADVAEAVRAACPDGPVAVRSSATAEDLPDASFAGQQDTYLNVVGPDAVLDAVRRCWASLWTDRAVAYRDAHGIDHATVALAVVDPADGRRRGRPACCSPRTRSPGRRGEAVIDAAPGLGEAVVSGSVDPDHFVVDPDRRPITRRAGAGDSRWCSARAGGGTETAPHDGAGASLPDDDQCARWPGSAAGSRRTVGAPQDIEWAIDADGTPWLTQSRPITTLYPLPCPDARACGCTSRSTSPRACSGRSPRWASPPLRLLGLGVAAAARRPGRPTRAPGPPCSREAGERLFVDVTDVLRSRVGRRSCRGCLGRHGGPLGGGARAPSSTDPSFA